THDTDPRRIRLEHSQAEQYQTEAISDQLSDLALTLGGHHDPDQVGGVPRAEFLHDVGAVILDRARADPKMPSRFLVGSTRSELLKHLAFAPRERFASGKMQRRNPGC